MEEGGSVVGSKRRTLFLVRGISFQETEAFKAALRKWWDSGEDVGAICCLDETRLEVYDIPDDTP